MLTTWVVVLDKMVRGVQVGKSRFASNLISGSDLSISWQVMAYHDIYRINIVISSPDQLVLSLLYYIYVLTWFYVSHFRPDPLSTFPHLSVIVPLTPLTLNTLQEPNLKHRHGPPSHGV